MKTFIAYTLVVIGVPVLVGLLLGSIISLPVTWVLRRNANVKISTLLYLEVFNGVGAVLAAAILFRLFGMSLNLAVLIIMAIWVTLYFVGYKQPARALVSCLVGMLIAWLIISRTLF